MELEGSTFLVTGGASGLGAATVRSVVAGGGYAVIADLKEAEGAALAQELGKPVRFVRTDVTDEASGKAAVQAAVDGFGGLHGLVNCAGVVYGEKVVGKEGPHSLAGFANMARALRTSYPPDVSGFSASRIPSNSTSAAAASPFSGMSTAISYRTCS